MIFDDKIKSGIKDAIASFLNTAANKENVNISLTEHSSFWHSFVKTISDLESSYTTGISKDISEHSKQIIFCCCICCALSTRTAKSFFNIKNHISESKAEALYEVIYSELILGIYFMHSPTTLDAIKKDGYHFKLLKDIFRKGCGREKLRLETLVLISELVQFGFMASTNSTAHPQQP